MRARAAPSSLFFVFVCFVFFALFVVFVFIVLFVMMFVVFVFFVILLVSFVVFVCNEIVVFVFVFIFVVFVCLFHFFARHWRQRGNRRSKTRACKQRVGSKNTERRFENSVGADSNHEYDGGHFVFPHASTRHTSVT